MKLYRPAKLERIEVVWEDAQADSEHPHKCRGRNRYADREVADRQTLYAAGEPQRKEAALVRWFALFGVVRKRPANI